MPQQHANPVTLENLQRGLDQLFALLREQGRPSKGSWDFHNDLYRQLEARRRRGLDYRFWSFLVDELWDWKAIRGTSQHTKQGIRDAGLRQFPDLQRCFYDLAGEATNDLRTIETLVWGDVEPLFKVAGQIKAVSSPTFASKLCHFLVPGAFFITDGKLVKRGWKTYRHYWEDCQAAWLTQSNKQAMKDALCRSMPVNCIPWDTYPWPTKITELCQFDIR
jgi:hypothetical protein